MKINEVEAAVGVTKKEHPLLRGRGAYQPQPGAGQRLPQLLAGGCGAPAPHQAAA